VRDKKLDEVLVLGGEGRSLGTPVKHEQRRRDPGGRILVEDDTATGVQDPHAPEEILVVLTAPEAAFRHERLIGDGPTGVETRLLHGRL